MCRVPYKALLSCSISFHMVSGLITSDTLVCVALLTELIIPMWKFWYIHVNIKTKTVTFLLHVLTYVLSARHCLTQLDFSYRVDGWQPQMSWEAEAARKIIGRTWHHSRKPWKNTEKLIGKCFEKSDFLFCNFLALKLNLGLMFSLGVLWGARTGFEGWEIGVMNLMSTNLECWDCGGCKCEV